MTSLPPYRVTTKPWFGPRRRAREQLAGHRTTVLSPEESIRELQRLLGPHAGAIQELRFIDYVHRGQSFRYTIALVWMDSDPQARDRAYDCAESMVQATGWYPLPQGERMQSALKLSAFKRGLSLTATPPRIAEPLSSLTSAVPVGDGAAIRLSTGSEGVLLDTGLPGRLEPAHLDRLVLLTHSHRDHSGGLDAVIKARIPVVMSEGTAGVLATVAPAQFRRLDDLIVVRPGDVLELGGVRVESFAVPHTLGATGFAVSDGTRNVVYPGDVSLRTSRHDFLPRLQAQFAAGQENWLLLDATMAARPSGATTDNAAAELLEHSEQYSDLVVTAADIDLLLYAYLDVFHNVSQSARRHSVSFLVAPRLRPLFETTHSAFIQREHEDLDPFILGQYKATMTAWAESRWLYWMNDARRFQSPGKRIWFVPANERKAVAPSGRAGVVYVGRGDVPDPLPWPADSLDVPTTAWSLHSGTEVLRDAIRAIGGDARIVLFHDFPRRLRKFSNSFDHDAELTVLSQDAVELSS